MRWAAYALECLVVRSLSRRDRGSIVGDLNEELGHTPGLHRCWAVVRIAAHAHVEPYRHIGLASSILATVLVGVGLLWSVHAASYNMFADPTWLSNPLVRTAAVVWGASHVTASLATGLFVGRTTLVPETASSARWHIALLLGIALCALFPDTVLRLVAVSTFLVSLAVADALREYDVA